MSIHIALQHRSHYHYDRPVLHSPHIIRLRPAPHCRTRVLSYSLKITPQTHFINWQQDPFSNYQARIVFPDLTAELLIDVDLVAEMAVHNPFDFFLEPYADFFPFIYETSLKTDLKPFLETLPPGPRLQTFLDSIPLARRSTVDFLVSLNQRLWGEIRYCIRLEAGVQAPEETLHLRAGSCRDSAWLLVQILRHLGLAARFVSGYLIQLASDVKPLDGPSGPTCDFTDLHAWCEVYLPGAGWIGLDPTSGLLAGEGHLPLACTPEPADAAPISGATDPCEASFTHKMHVSRIFESPRVTKPYTDEEWNKINALGCRLDAELKSSDVRLTMGGEPTFISVDHMDGEEWNFTAIGPEKQHLSDVLIRRLKKRFAPGGLLHFGQGKWYPGESLPRWAYSCFWRKDLQPIWHDDSLFAETNANYGYTDADAKRFISLLARILNVSDPQITPAFEDAWYYLWRERRLPINVDPLNSKLNDQEESDRLARIFEQGLDRIAGYLLPLQRKCLDSKPAWISSPWFFRREHCFLIPGDSPMGLRLPLDSIPWVSPSDYPYLQVPDPMTDAHPLIKPAGISSDFLAQTSVPHPLPISNASGQLLWQRHIGSQPSENAGRSDRSVSSRRPALGESAGWIIRSALCVEPRHGRLHVFMPPVGTTEDYLHLIAAIEETAAELKFPVVIEGETPQNDSRLNVFKLTPDPGVIEVNVPPVQNWDEQVSQTKALYEEARFSRLAAEKFLIDGRHVGTGGGNHIVIGGPTPADSPILRRPDLLRSMLGYWQNHPSLSFLFSSQFIGPTSQHPRIDEARNDSLYELEIAFLELDRQQNRVQAPAVGAAIEPVPVPITSPPWLVDRLFRNLLIDSTGNTHRAEFCMDKLFSPDSNTGRLGLLEMRAFEMPPHPQMSLTQNLLLRALIAHFWNDPYQRPLIRWGTSLHDRFMLPHFVEQDFRDVILDLNRGGFPLKFEWFLPHFEFRFPKYGDVTYQGVNLEIRQALEPWPVLGEEGRPGGSVRHVDSSLERLQVKLQGMIDTRHFLTTNGRWVPLHPTGVKGEYVAGIRFRAWQPPECLQPTIGVQSPLIFDIMDHRYEHSLGGCTYHVAHPGGRNYSTLPVNANEAESRRLARFFPHGHTPGRMTVTPGQTNADFPFTLDLRRF